MGLGLGLSGGGGLVFWVVEVPTPPFPFVVPAASTPATVVVLVGTMTTLPAKTRSGGDVFIRCRLRYRFGGVVVAEQVTSARITGRVVVMVFVVVGSESPSELFFVVLGVATSIRRLSKPIQSKQANVLK